MPYIKFKKYIAILIIEFLLIPVWAWAGVCYLKQPITLKMAAIYALKHSPDLDTYWRTFNISALKMQNTQAKFLPTVDIRSRHYLENEDSGYTNSGTKIEATENIFNNGEDLTNIKINKLQALVDQLSYLHERDLLIANIASDFVELSLQEKLYALNQNHLKLLQEQYTLTLDKYHNGLRTEEDVGRFHNLVQNAAIQVLDAKNTADSQKQKLLMDMGMAASDVAACNNPAFKIIDLPKISIDLNALSTPSIKQQFAYKAVTIQRHINILEMALVKNKLLPQVDVKTGISYGNNSQHGFVSSFGNRKDVGWHAGLEFRYNLFDGGRRRRDVEIKRATTLSNLDKQLHDLLLTKQQLNNFVLGLQQHIASYHISEKLAVAEQKQYELMQQKYRDGKITYLDLINAIDSLLNAQTQYLSDRYNLEKDLYTYQFYRERIYAFIFTKK